MNKRVKLGELEEGKEYVAYNEVGRLQPIIKYRKREDVLEYVETKVENGIWTQTRVNIFYLFNWEFEEIVPFKIKNK